MAQSQSLPPTHRLPLFRSPIIGRQREIETIADLVQQDDVPLLTLTGPGGVGKTRLALAVADRLSDLFPAGVIFVPLAPLQDPALVVPTIASALGVAERIDSVLADLLTGHIGERALLLVLDNLEHVTGAVRDVGRLIAGCPNLTILATSRTPLHLYEEHEYPVSPLPLPAGAETAIFQEIAGSEAVVLFCGRAQAVQPSFALTDENAQLIAAICTKLDGLPLAMELAAPWLRMFSPQQLLDRLEHPLSVLTSGPRDAPDRQRTLRNTIAWSYELLNEGEQALFRALCVCRGGWTLEAAEAIAADREQVGTVLADLNTLIEQNLIQRIPQPDGSVRFGMLETVREFGADEAVTLGEQDVHSERHARYYISLAIQSRDEQHRGAIARAVRDTEPDLENLRAAFQWVFTQESPDPSLVEEAVHGSCLGVFWRAKGLLAEGRRWAEMGLAQPGILDGTRAAALSEIGWLAIEQGDFAVARARLEEAMAIVSDLGDEQAETWITHGLGRLAMWQADHARTIEIHEQGLALARRRGDRRAIQALLANLAVIVAIMGDIERGEHMLLEAQAMLREFVGSVDPIILMDFAILARMRGNLEEARRLIVQSLSIEREMGPSRIVANCFEVCASLAICEHYPERAARLYGAAATLRLKSGVPVKPLDRELFYEPFAERSQRELGESAWNDAWAAGRGMEFDEAVEYALAFEGEPGTPCTSTESPLSRREKEVLRYIVDGCSNQEIAAVLYISPHTVANHVAHILNKLDVDSRTAAAIWAIREGVV